MAVSKLWPVKSKLSCVINYATNPQKTDSKLFTNEEYQSLKDVLSYAKDEEKTEKEFYVEGINSNPLIARDEFVLVKEQFNKTDGIQAYHGYLSFKETNITPDFAQKIGMEFVNEVWGERFQAVVTTHLNTTHLHCHFVINSISFVDGKRCQDTSWFKFRKVADRICQKYGIYYNENPYRTKQSDFLTMKEKAGIPTRYSIAREAIDKALEHSTNINQFKYALKEMGYIYQMSSSRKYWTVIPKGYNKPIRLKNLGEEYTNQSIMQRLRENSERWIDIKPFQPKTAVKKYNSQAKKGSIYRLYLYYCYRLGYFPKHKNQDSARLHYLLKEDLIKLDKITDEVRLMGRERISTEHQLFSYKEKVIKEIESLTKDRDELRKILRRSLSEENLSEVKSKIKYITEKLKILRKDLSLCDSIIERSKTIQTNIMQIEEDESKEKRKEEKQHESWR